MMQFLTFGRVIQIITQNISEYKERFFDVINRGGLSKPSDAIFLSTLHSQEFFDRIFRCDEIRSVMLRFKKSRAVFVQSFTRIIVSHVDTAFLVSLNYES